MRWKVVGVDSKLKVSNLFCLMRSKAVDRSSISEELERGKVR